MKYILTSLLSFTLFYSAHATHAEKNGRTVVTAKGDKITFTQPQHSNVGVINKETGEKELKSFEKVAERPLSLNGKMIVYDFKTNPQLLDVAKKLVKLVSDGLGEAENKMSEGCYEFIISDIVIDERGNVAYYSKAEAKSGVQMTYNRQKMKYHDIAEDEKVMVEKAMKKLMAELKAEPLIIHGKAVPYIIQYKTYPLP